MIVAQAKKIKKQLLLVGLLILLLSVVGYGRSYVTSRYVALDRQAVNKTKNLISKKLSSESIKSSDTNIISIINKALFGNENPNNSTKISIVSTSSSQVSKDGTITYGDTQTTAQVTVGISKGSYSSTSKIVITIPAKNDSSTTPTSITTPATGTSSANRSTSSTATNINPTTGAPIINNPTSSSPATDVGWVPTLTIDNNAGTYWSSMVSCANYPPTQQIICVYEGNGVDTDPNDSYVPIDLYYKISNDGGVTFSSARYKLTSDPGDEYAPFMEYDVTTGKLILTYSMWYDGTGTNGNKIMTRLLTLTKGSDNVSWLGPYTVAASKGSNYWDSSVLYLKGGKLLAFFSVEGSEGNRSGYLNGNGYLQYRTSSDGGTTWDAPRNPIIGTTYQTCMDEEHPVAVQKSDGVIRLLYRNRGAGANTAFDGRCTNMGAGDADIWQIWSEDNGVTWKGQSGFRQTSGPDIFSYIDSQDGNDQIVMMILQNSDGTFSPYHMYSGDGGVTWQGPYLTAEDSYKWPHWENINPYFTMGCRGFVAGFTSPVSATPKINKSQIYVRAFHDGTNTCSQ